MKTAFQTICIAIISVVWLTCSSTAEGTGIPKPSPGQYKIGVVNVKRVFDAYEKQKDEYALLQKTRDQKQKKIDELSATIEKNKERYETERDSMTPETISDLEDRIESDYSLYKAEFRRLQEDIDRREKKLLESIFKEIHLSIQEVGTQGNYHLVLEGGESGRSGLLFFSTTLNMTQQVIDYLNENYRRSK
ncbi:MAG: OmpH family outer membrane protein [Candidatus Hydrogenedentes bacterium]|nr:OmpH family outer membrane protein [Candidatus Hydrogenedentota bacterium]